MFFSPLLVILFYQKSYKSCLWIAFFCGLFLDLLTSDIRLGLHAMNYVMTTAILYPQRRNFFSDNLSTLPVMTFLFSFLSTAIQIIQIYAMQKENVSLGLWIIFDLIKIPIYDAGYAFAVFVIPAIIFGAPSRKGKDYFQG